jgi:diguanylate cyclase (GGDEF)-like protein/PAS domain S-box-containing protein
MTPAGGDVTPDEVRITRAQLSHFLVFVTEALVAFDAGGIITFASPALATLIGFHPEMVVGHSVAEYLHPDDLGRVLQMLEQWGGRSGNTAVAPLRIRQAGGEWLEVMVDAVSGVEVEPLGAFIVTLRRVGDSSDVEQQLRERLANESRLVRLASAFVDLSADRLEDGIEDALAEMSGLRGVDRVELVLYDEATREWVNTHEWAAPNIPRLKRTTPRVGDDESALIRALRDSGEVSIPSAEALGEGWEAEVRWFRARKVGSMIAVPMLDEGRVIGFMGFEAVNREFLFASDHLLTLRPAAGILAQAVARQLAERRLAHQSRHDRLTGLPNRWAFLDGLTLALDRMARRQPHGPGLAVVLFDLDRFKVVNESLGHGFGDALLVTLARRLEDARPTGSILARMGGDELVVLLEGVETPGDAAVIARDLSKVLSRSVMVEGHEVTATASAGIAFTDDADESADDLLRHADAAMYAAKELGRDRIEVFDETLRSKVRRRLTDEIDLRHAIEHGELIVHYQPEIEVPSGVVLGAEALVRWQHPTRGLLAAAEFIDLAEETGLILDIGRWVLGEACRQQVRWEAEHPDRELVVRVNLSARQVAEPDLLTQVVAILSESGIDPAHLCLEITETTVMADAENSLEVLEKLRGLGVELAIDDFGTGYSSLSYLKRFPVHVLKIDRSFVDGLGRDPDDTAIVQAILVLASSLGMSVTAEGVETEAQLTELLRLGCGRVQGYFFARPQPPEELASLLRSGTT